MGKKKPQTKTKQTKKQQKLPLLMISFIDLVPRYYFSFLSRKISWKFFLSLLSLLVELTTEALMVKFWFTLSSPWTITVHFSVPRSALCFHLGYRRDPWWLENCDNKPLWMETLHSHSQETSIIEEGPFKNSVN